MKMYQLKCPACGASIEIEKDRESCFCSYCGTKILVDDNVRHVKITKNINYYKSYTDEAKIRRIESQERMQERKHAAEREERKAEKWYTVVVLLVLLVCFIGGYVLFDGYFDSLKEASDQQERELQAIVDEVMQDIEDGNFEEAYLLAETIRYTENWSDEIEDKWDEIRKALIKQIKEAEREATKGEGGGTWWNPFD